MAAAAATLIPALVGAGTSIAGAVMGGKKTQAEIDQINQNKYAQKLYDNQWNATGNMNAYGMGQYPQQAMGSAAPMGRASASGPMDILRRRRM